ncbi:ELL-associated factor [Fasciola hepatica]|uniref:ELL-associated factor n=1 Tax=Fasciola hepatica TaxID=6192 RepID=A0A4E0RP30_FASHE|nr:ELL-associated factor [Fasciola hepatica]
MQLNGTFDVKLGKSFLEPSSATYITMRCDFMPASVDRTKPGSIRVDESKEVVVNLPNVASVAAGSTVFRGSARPVQKECILIYNKRTGELTLERIAHSVQLKKTREERKANAPIPQSNRSGPINGGDTNKAARTPSINQPRSLTNQSRDSTTPRIASKSHTVCSPKNKPPEQAPRPSTASSVVKSTGQTSKARTLSSSSSSSSDSSDGEMNLTPNGSNHPPAVSTSHPPDDSDTDGSDSDLSSISSLSDKETTNHPTKNASREDRSSLYSSSNAIQSTVHRRLIENDLKLSDTDSDSC